MQVNRLAKWEKLRLKPPGDFMMRTILFVGEELGKGRLSFNDQSQE
jgi:hypothetical protein